MQPQNIKSPSCGQPSGKRPIDELTHYDWFVIELIASGLRDREISGIVGKSYFSVKKTVKGIFDKVGVDNRLQLAIWFVSTKGERAN